MSADHSRQSLTAVSTAPKQLLILLLGGRIQPAAMLALQRQPDVVVCIHSLDEPQTATQIGALLRQRFPNLHLAPPMAVAAYAPEQTRTAIAQALAHFPDHQPAISLTGAPMPMVVGAYDMAQQVACPAYYLNTTEGQILDLAQATTTTAFTLRVTLADFLLIHGQRWMNQTAYPLLPMLTALYTQTARRLLADLPTATALLHWLNERRGLETPQRRVWPLQAKHWRLLEEFHHLGLCQKLERTPTAKSSYVRYGVEVATHRQFLSGGWLEWAVADCAQAAGRFDECAQNLIIRSGDAQREVDFLAVRRGQGVLASCKAVRRFWDKAFLDELSAAARPLGDNYCSKLFITNQPQPAPGTPSAAALPQFLKHAATQRIVVVTGERLPALTAIFQQESEKPTYARR